LLVLWNDNLYDKHDSFSGDLFFDSSSLLVILNYLEIKMKTIHTYEIAKPSEQQCYACLRELVGLLGVYLYRNATSGLVHNYCILYSFNLEFPG